MMGHDSAAKLHRAIKHGDQAYIRAYVQSGGDLGVRDSEGWTPLLRAADRGDVAVLQLLLNAGARVDDGLGETMTPLTAAALAGHRDAIALLLSHGADPDPPPAGRLSQLLDHYGPDRTSVATMLSAARKDRDRAV
jgi:ankyrin repeat protein